MAHRHSTPVAAFLISVFLGVAAFTLSSDAPAQSTASGDNAPQVQDPNAGLIDLIFKTIGLGTANQGAAPADSGTYPPASDTTNGTLQTSSDATCGDGKEDDCPDSEEDDSDEDDDDDDEKEDDDD